MAGRPAWKGQKRTEQHYWFVCLSNEIGCTIIKFATSRPLVKLCLNVHVSHGHNDQAWPVTGNSFTEIISIVWFDIKPSS